MTVSNYAGGVFCYTEIQGDTYVLLGRNRWKGSFDIFSAKRNTSLDDTPWELTLEESLAAKVEMESIGILNGQEMYNSIVYLNPRSVTLYRGRFEYKVFIVKLEQESEEVFHNRQVRVCSCIPCAFRNAARDPNNPITELTWVKLDALQKGYFKQNNLQETLKNIIPLLNKET